MRTKTGSSQAQSITCKKASSIVSINLHSSDAMFCRALLRSARCASTAVVRTQMPTSRSIAPTSFLRSSQLLPAASFQGRRCYSAPAGLSKQEVEGRIMDLLKNFDKVCLYVSVGLTDTTNGTLGPRSYQGIRIERLSAVLPRAKHIYSCRTHHTLRMIWDLIVWTRSRWSWPLKRYQ